MTIHWSSIAFRGAKGARPIVYCHDSRGGSFILVFDSWAELSELVNTLNGALTQHKLQSKSKSN